MFKFQKHLIQYFLAQHPKVLAHQLFLWGKIYPQLSHNINATTKKHTGNPTNTLHLFQRGNQTQFIHFLSKNQVTGLSQKLIKAQGMEEKEDGNHPHPLFGTPEIGQRLISSYQRSPRKPERLEGEEEREEEEEEREEEGGSVGP